MKLLTFKKGGIHPNDNKITASEPIQNMPLPKEVCIPLSQSLGAMSKLIVSKGSFVKTGELIAQADGFISANVHSSVTGTVKKIDECLMPSGYRSTCVVIETEPDQFYFEETNPNSFDLEKISSQDIINKIKEMGIVGMGGATFPTHIKLMVPSDKKAETLLINAAECEPYLTADHRQMIEKSEGILMGIAILMKSVNASRAVIGIENNKKDAIDLLTEKAKNFKGIEIQPLKVKYPQGSEKHLIQAVTKKQLPFGKLPIELGCVVINVGTAYAVFEAIAKNKPLYERIVTVSGKNLKKPSNYNVRIGTSIGELLEHCGGVPDDTCKIISGGPMMGKALQSLETPVIKGTSGVLVFDKNETERNPVQSCIRCARCVNVCPMGLEPYLLEKLSNMKQWDIAEQHRITDCIECGSCQYSCPANRTLLDFIRLGKFTVTKNIRNRSKK